MSKILWRGSARSIVLSWGLLAIFAVTFGIIVISNIYAAQGEKIEGALWIAPISVLVIGAAISMWSSGVIVEVDEDEMRVKFGPGWPMRRFPWATIASVEYIDVRPWQFGGWGYKVVLRKRTQAYVLRAGDGLRVSFIDGRVFVVTVDGARRGLEVIRGILRLK